MTTRAMVAISLYGQNAYGLYYRHCDGYPNGLGIELLQTLQEIKEQVRLGLEKPTCVEEILKLLIERVHLQDEHRTVGKAEDAFLKVQGDLEYIYAIENLDQLERTRVEIYKTSNPHTKVDFAFRIWGSYLQYAPQTLEHISSAMSRIEANSNMVLHAIAAYEEAKIEQDKRIELKAQ